MESSPPQGPPSPSLGFPAPRQGCPMSKSDPNLCRGSSGSRWLEAAAPNIFKVHSHPKTIPRTILDRWGEVTGLCHNPTLLPGAGGGPAASATEPEAEQSRHSARRAAVPSAAGGGPRRPHRPCQVGRAPRQHRPPPMLNIATAPVHVPALCGVQRLCFARRCTCMGGCLWCAARCVL